QGLSDVPPPSPEWCRDGSGSALPTSFSSPWRAEESLLQRAPDLRAAPTLVSHPPPRRQAPLASDGDCCWLASVRGPVRFPLSFPSRPEREQAPLPRPPTKRKKSGAFPPALFFTSWFSRTLR